MELVQSLLEGLIKVLGIVAPILFGLYKYQTDRKDKKQKEEIEGLKQEKEAHKFNSNVLASLLKLRLYHTLEETTNRVFKKTRATRLIIFIAVNGKVEPKRVYSLFGKKIDNDAIDEDYRIVEIDDNYRTMLHDLEYKGKTLLDVLFMPKGMLKNIYFQEEISYSYLKFLKRYSLNKEDDAIVYISIATDHERNFTDKELTVIDLEVSNNITPLLDRLVN